MLATLQYAIKFQFANKTNKQFIEDIVKKISNINGKKPSKFFLFKSIGIAIHQVNAMCVMGTIGSMGKLEELNYL